MDSICSVASAQIFRKYLYLSMIPRNEWNYVTNVGYNLKFCVFYMVFFKNSEGLLGYD